MDTDTWLGAPSASASSARADDTPAVSATEHDQHMESTTELAASSASGSPACTEQTLCCLYYELLTFFSAALKDVGRASAPQWFSLDEECDIWFATSLTCGTTQERDTTLTSSARHCY